MQACIVKYSPYFYIRLRPADLGILLKLVACSTPLRRNVFTSLLGEVRIFFKFSVYMAEKSPLLLLDYRSCITL